MNLDQVKPGDVVHVKGGKFEGRKGRFCSWPKTGRKSAYIELDGEIGKQNHCLCCTSLTFFPGAAAAASAGTKRTRRASPPSLSVEIIDAPPVEESNDEERSNMTKDDVIAMMTAFSELRVELRVMSDRVAKLEFSGSK